MVGLDQGWSDPARLHAPGRRARALLDAALESLAAVLGCRPDEVHWAASGPTAAQEAVLGTLAARARTGRRFVTSAVEHAAVLHAGEWHAGAGGEVVVVAVDAEGAVDASSYAAAVSGPGASLASLQSANGEVGTRQPIAAVHAVCAAAGVPLHVDATASIGHADLPVVELLTADLRAVGGPPGVGLLVRRTGTRWRRPGPDPAAVPPVPLLVAAAACLVAVEAERRELARRHAGWTAWLRAEIPRRIPDVVLAGPARAQDRLPHLLTASFLYVDGEALVGALAADGLAVDSGSACTADTLEPSHVLAAMGALTHGNVRLSLGRDTTEADVARLLDVLPALVARLREGTAGL